MNMRHILIRLFKFLNTRPLTEMEWQPVLNLPPQNQLENWRKFQPHSKTLERLAQVFQPFNEALKSYIKTDGWSTP